MKQCLLKEVLCTAGCGVVKCTILTNQRLDRKNGGLPGTPALFWSCGCNNFNLQLATDTDLILSSCRFTSQRFNVQVFGSTL